ncbi:MAG: cytochrome b/b6 domain-containing protein [Acidobacteria bacterium]|nr:cytochrome b/b6 domain-containing protein [Acidobacteriota bacterium]
MKTERVKLYRRYERFWHWMQALLVITLILTGFEVHGTLALFGFQAAVYIHELAAQILIVLVVFTIFWHFTTGEWKQYKPAPLGELIKVIRYYVFGMFKNESHPHKKTELSKLNPLQRATYLALKIVLFPLQIGSGLLYLYYNEISTPGNGISLKTIATVHIVGAFLLLIFLIVHLYMTTTGRTVFTNLIAMITGYEELPVEAKKK